MRRYSALLVEDSEPCVTVLRDYLSRLPLFCLPVVAQSTNEACSLLIERKFDVVFLDIIQSEGSGRAVLDALPRQLPVIVTSSDPSYAAECYDLDVADYLVKPYSFPRFTRAVNRALGVQVAANILADRQSVYLKVGRMVQRFDYETIDFAEAYGIYTKIWYNQKTVVVNETISALENRLPKEQFMRVHKSYIVNLSKVTMYAHANVWIGTAKIPIGLLHRPRFEGFFRLADKLCTHGQKDRQAMKPAIIGS